MIAASKFGLINVQTTLAWAIHASRLVKTQDALSEDVYVIPRTQGSEVFLLRSARPNSGGGKKYGSAYFFSLILRAVFWKKQKK